MQITPARNGFDYFDCYLWCYKTYERIIVFFLDFVNGGVKPDNFKAIDKIVRSLRVLNEKDPVNTESNSWQGLADEFGTFDWVKLHKELTPFPEFISLKMGWILKTQKYDIIPAYEKFKNL